MCRNHRRNCRAGLGRNGKVAPSSLFLSSAFSVNTLTLFGHVLAVGIVVDDAIVVAEALQHHLEHGLSPREATVKAMKEVSGSVIMIALVLCAFCACGFHGRSHWAAYQQFAITVAVAVVFSAINALTLSPLDRSTGKKRGPSA